MITPSKTNDLFSTDPRIKELTSYFGFSPIHFDSFTYKFAISENTKIIITAFTLSSDKTPPPSNPPKNPDDSPVLPAPKIIPYGYTLFYKIDSTFLTDLSIDNRSKRGFHVNFLNYKITFYTLLNSSIKTYQQFLKDLDLY